MRASVLLTKAILDQSQVFLSFGQTRVTKVSSLKNSTDIRIIILTWEVKPFPTFFWMRIRDLNTNKRGRRLWWLWALPSNVSADKVKRIDNVQEAELRDNYFDATRQ